MEFHVGQRIMATCHLGAIQLEKDIGTIIVKQDRDSFGIEFDRNVGGHDCNGLCKPNHGWFLPSSYFTPIGFSIVGLEELI